MIITVYINIQDSTIKKICINGIGLKLSLCDQWLGGPLIDLVKTQCNNLYPNKKNHFKLSQWFKSYIVIENGNRKLQTV